MIVVAELLAVEAVAGKDKLKKISVRVDAEGATKTIVTNAPNVVVEKVGQRLVVALEGAEVPGLEAVVKRTSVGGVASEGIVCDSRMVGWSGGGAGVAVFLGDDDAEVGASPPAKRPRPKAAQTEGALAPVTDGLFEKKLSREEKKKAAKAAREARKAKKSAATSSDSAS